jgi:hypothetical protein
VGEEENKLVAGEPSFYYVLCCPHGSSVDPLTSLNSVRLGSVKDPVSRQVT